MRRALVAALLLATAGCTGDPPAEDPFAAFVAGWQRADFTGVELRTPAGQPLPADAARRLLADTEGDLAARRPVVARHGAATVRKNDAKATAGVDWTLPDGRHWAYETTLEARRIDGRWAVYLGPAVVHPDLPDGARMTLRATPATRGLVLAADGTPIVSEVPVVYVGVEPRLVRDVDALVQRLDVVFRSVRVPVDVSALPARIRAAKPDAFVDLVTLRKRDYAEIERDLAATDGVTTRAGTLSLPLTRTFGRALLGTSGPATKELIDASGGTLRPGDVTGLTGLQRRYDTALRGTPRLEVLAKEQVLYTAPAVDGAKVRTTVEVRTQQAAETALAATASRSALVAVRVGDGAVLAAANGPDAAGYNLAFLAEVPSPPLGVDGAAAGFGAQWRLGADMFTGRVTPSGVVGSPLVYAAAAAAVARGRWRQPVLVIEPSPGPPAVEGPAVTGPLTVPGMSVRVQGDVAFCVYVEGAGQDVTGPIADAFARSLTG
ncbi:hypothetical protein Daura_36160 [Dactylosporangium aurantiacum]|uniref:beta-lactamase n=1 Tax=Dactylosporangium aurantiacum TaxID=35754 RepID=A0A9Q9IAA5_9ACTN|nr:NTF2-like N-terminal transpeptidase domain-containing protein [Dactylosporangium aurantiacum]MDG6103391.1 NTF2-like N-terminal transpeptidase domain-containing protein [Dactylosporangium aurantiacum]UWZ52096.1 hypothetical protein Daura_36160 [Dactylosporangium aurantiacum]